MVLTTRHESGNNRYPLDSVSGSSKLQKTQTRKPQEFKFFISKDQSKLSWDFQQGDSVFVFGESIVKKTPSESKKLQESCCAEHTAQKDTLKAKEEKNHTYVIRNQELKIEESKRTQRKSENWKRRQQHKLGRNAKVFDVSRCIMKSVQGSPRIEREELKKEKHATTRLK